MKNTDNTLQNLLDKSFSEFNLVQGSLVKALTNDPWTRLNSLKLLSSKFCNVLSVFFIN